MNEMTEHFSEGDEDSDGNNAEIYEHTKLFHVIRVSVICLKETRDECTHW